LKKKEKKRRKKGIEWKDNCLGDDSVSPLLSKLYEHKINIVAAFPNKHFTKFSSYERNRRFYTPFKELGSPGSSTTQQ